jgi:hypothetical protein
MISSDPVPSNPQLERATINGRIAKWLDAQHQYTDIAQRVGQRHAPHAVAALAATGHIRPTPHPTPRPGAAGAAGAAGAVSVGPAAA